MTDKSVYRLKADLESLGWKCSESESSGRYTVLATLGEKSIASSGYDRLLIWNAVHRDALQQRTGGSGG